MPDISFRQATPSDAVCIAVLATQVFLDTYAIEGIRLQLANEALENYSPGALSALLAKPGVSFIIAERTSHLIAFAQLTDDSTHHLLGSGLFTELNRLYVQRPFTRRGIGKSLIQRAEARASAQGATALWLTAWADNHRALAFYASQGYKDLGATPFSYQGDDYENRVLAKALPSRR